MAILKEIVYEVECDGCGKVYRNEYSGSSIFDDKDLAKEEAQDNHWLIEDGKCYCPKCQDIDEDNNVIIKTN